MENIKNLKKPKAPPPVKQERIEKAVDALLKWVKSQPKYQKPQLLEHDEFLYMVINLKKIPAKERTNPYKIRIPNPLVPLDGSQEICLIINDGEKRTSRVSSEFAKAKIKEESLPISKVLKYSKLKTVYKRFEAKKKLCGSYDMFMADRSVIPLLPRHLEKMFFKKKKHPIPMDLSHVDLDAIHLPPGEDFCIKRARFLISAFLCPGRILLALFFIAASSNGEIISCRKRVSQCSIKNCFNFLIEWMELERKAAAGERSNSHLEGAAECFKFDKVFGPDITQENILFEVSPMVQSALDGHKVCIFAYGQSGSGKTYTMFGRSDDDYHKGIVPRTLEQIFSLSQDLHTQNWNLKMQASVLEIYNETIKDLARVNYRNAQKQNIVKHKLKQDANKSTFVSGLTLVEVTTCEDVSRLLK